MRNDTKGVPRYAKAAILEVMNLSNADAKCQRAKGPATTAQLEGSKKSGLGAISAVQPKDSIRPYLHSPAKRQD